MGARYERDPSALAFGAARVWALRARQPLRGGLGIGSLVGASAAQDVAHRVVPFMARVFEWTLTRVFLRQVHRKRPWFRPGRRVVNGDGPFDRGRPDRLEAFDEAQPAAGAAVRALLL